MKRYGLHAIFATAFCAALFGLQPSPAAQVVISEFMAINDDALTNDFGVASDWIELYNAGSNAVDLAGWHLTDKTNDLTKWSFPSVSLGESEFLLVYASGLNRTNPAAPLHTNFKLDGAGEYLALVESDGVTVAHHYTPAFPGQYSDISYGLSMPRYSRLIGHWAFDDASSTASLLADTSAGGDDKSGTFVSGATPGGVSGVVGGAVELFGNQNISLGSSTEYDRTTWTASMWLYNDSGVTGWRTAFGSWNAGGQSAVHVGRDSAGTWGDHGGGQTSGGSVQDATWTHIVSLRTPDGQENSLWIDGVKQAQVSSGGPGLPGSADVYLGTKNGAENHWDGRIDDLGYFDDTLTPGEIVAIHDVALSPFEYDLASMQVLFELHRAGNGSVTVAGDIWGYAGGLGSVEGLVTGGGATNLVLDGQAGTGVQLGLAGPPPVMSGSISTNARAFFTMPTPGSANGVGLQDLGPTVSDATDNLPAVSDAEGIVVTARVEATAHPIGQVSLNYRVMYGSETAVTMLDDGVAPDAAGGDGVFTVVIPASASGPGDMVRWAVTAADTQTNQTRVPRFPVTTVSPEYFGTVVADPGVTSALPILQWFVEDPAAATVVSGTRASVFYNGEFYDNVFVRRRGQTSANWPKKSYKFEFNEGNHFRFDSNLPRVDEFNLNTTYTDKAYTRTIMSFEAYRDAGSASCESFMVRVQQNGGFFSVAIFIEQPDRDYLRRNGRDPDGALYKVRQNSIWGIEAYRGSASSGIEKKTRHHEDVSDMQALIDGMALTGADLERYLYDNVDLPACVTYMAASVAIQNIDRTLKNFYLYRDTEGDGEWEFFPWDVDLAFGPDALNTDVIVASDDSGSGSSHPFMGTEDHTFRTLWNGLLDAIIETPSTREMFLRRLRTVMDDFLGTTRFEDRIDALVADLGPDVLLDKAAWGADAHFGSTDYTLSEANTRIKNEYLTPRHTHLFTTHVTGGVGIPAEQAGIPTLTFGALEYNPSSGNQDEEYVELVNSNAVAVDISGWTIEGGIEHTFQPGTVIVAGGSLYLSPNAAAFRARGSSPRGGEGRFVQGGYQGHLSSFGETVQLTMPDGTLVAQTNYPGNPSDQQRYLRVSELHYNPAASNPAMGELSVDNDEFEFIELLNTGSNTLDLTDVALTNAVSFTFPATNLPAGGRVLVVGNLAAFESRYSAGLNVAGVYTGSLNNGGESVKLEDAGNSTIGEFAYNDARGWPLAADGAGHSLVPLVWTDQPHGALNYGGNWRRSAYIGGSPGAADPVLATTVVINEFAAHTDYTGGQPWQDSNDKIELYNAASSSVTFNSAWYLSDDALELTKWRISSASLASGAWVTYTEVDHFHTATNVGFGLDKSGEEIFLSYLPAAATNSRVVDCVRFKGQENGVTLGYLPDGDAAWFALSPTFGAANATAGDHLVIDEIMYHPNPDVKDNEYIEIYNPTVASVTLQEAETLSWGPPHWSATWRIDGGVSYSFPSNTVIAAGERIVVVGFDPAVDTAALNGFLGAYDLTNGQVRLLGPYAGDLSDEGERVALEKPQAPDAQTEPESWVIIDEVIYFDRSPWPSGADGAGATLQRNDPTGSGNDPASWIAQTVTPGTGALDADGDGLPDEWEIWYFGTTYATYDGHDDADGMSNGGEFTAGTDPTNTASVFAIDIAPGDVGPVVQFTALAASGPGYEDRERYYDLEYSSNLVSGSWLPVAGCTNILGQDHIVTYTNGHRRSAVYRARAELRDGI